MYFQGRDFQTGECSTASSSVNVYGSQFVVEPNSGKKKRSISQDEVKYGVVSN